MPMGMPGNKSVRITLPLGDGTSGASQCGQWYLPAAWRSIIGIDATTGNTWCQNDRLGFKAATVVPEQRDSFQLSITFMVRNRNAIRKEEASVYTPTIGVYKCEYVCPCRGFHT